MRVKSLSSPAAGADGRALAQALPAQGASAAVLARSATELAETVALSDRAGGRASAFAADVTEAQEVRSAMAAVEQRRGPIDRRVNNAGIVGPLGRFAESD